MDKGGRSMSEVTHKQIIDTFEQWAPKSLAYDWDPIGLQVGNISQQTKNVLVTLDVFESVVDEAIENDVNLIIAHHPLLFNAVQSIDLNTPKGKIIEKLIKHDITVYAAHTNLDIAEGGVNDLLSDALNLSNVQPLVPFKAEKLFKLVVFVPHTHVEEVRNALSEKGAGFIGNYSHCTFQTAGQGTFMPLEGTNPYIGKQDILEVVEEMKIETIVEESILSDVLEAMQSAHPYEEVAYDVYPLQQTGKTYGLGRVGNLKEPTQFADFIDLVKESFQMKHVRAVGDINKQIERVAIVGGSGEKFIHDALKKKADVYITGDLTFHQAQDAEQLGLLVIDAGHYIEKIMKRGVASFIESSFPGLTVIQSTVNTDPFQYF